MGYVTGFLNSADKGKTLAMVCTCEYYRLSGVPAENIHGNLEFRRSGYHQYDNAGIRQLMRTLIKNRVRNSIVMVDEIDGVFPARFFGSKDQTLDLLGLWQYTKMGNHFLYTKHVGNSVDKIIDDCTQIACVPEYCKADDTVYIDVINGIDLDFPLLEIPNASRWFGIYDRWQPII